MGKKRFLKVIGLVMSLVMLCGLLLSGCGDDETDGSEANANVVTASDNGGIFSSSANLEYDLHPTRNADGSYTYHDICGQDWTIGFRVEELVHDGVINHYDLHEAMGFGHEPNIHTDMYVIAYGLGFVGVNSPEFGEIDVWGKLNDSEIIRQYILWYGDYKNRVFVDSDGDMVPIALDQLVVAIYGCEQYKEAQLNGQIAPNPFSGISADMIHEINAYNIEYELH